MAQGLAIPVFASKPTDTLLTVDAYAQETAAESKTAVKDIIDEGLGKGLDPLKGIAVGLKTVGSIGLKLPEGLGVDPKAILNDAMGQSNALMGAFNSMAGSIKGAVLNGITKDLIGATGVGAAIASIGGTVSKIASADLTTLKGLGTLVGGIANSPYAMALKNPKSLSAVATGILKQATVQGLPDAFKTFAAGVSDQSVLGRVTKGLLPTVVSTSNVNTLFNMATGKTKPNLKAFMPDVAGEYTRAFKNVGNPSVRDISSMMKTVGTSMVAIDSKWDKWVAPNGQERINMNIYKNASPDFQKAQRITSENVPIRVTAPGSNRDIGVSFGEPNDDTGFIAAAKRFIDKGDTSPGTKKVYSNNNGSNNLGLFGMGVYVPSASSGGMTAQEKAYADRLQAETEAFQAKVAAEKQAALVTANAAACLQAEFSELGL